MKLSRYELKLVGEFMKKKNIINLIKYYSENNDAGFRGEAYGIAKVFDSLGDHQLSEYIMALLSNANTFIPQMQGSDSAFFRKVEPSNNPLPLPEDIKSDVLGIVNAIGRHAGINKFLFQGAPGTGKTETAKQLARILERELYIIDFDYLVDSKLGQTSKNISQLFQEINDIPYPDRVIVLFDEIDALALDRTNSNDLREMGRATSSVLKGLDNLNDNIILIATTNLFSSFDKALIRRFDSTINFNRYTREELIEVAEVLLEGFLNKFKSSGRNIRLFRKIIEILDPIPYPGELENLIKTSVAFSNPSDELDYLRRIYFAVTQKSTIDIKELQNQKFTIREIEILTGISKSQVARELKE